MTVQNHVEKQERIDVYKNSVRFKNKKRILSMSNVQPWMLYDCGYKLNETARNYDLRLKMIEEFHNRYHFDAYKDYWTRNPMNISDILGSSLYTLDDDTYGVNFQDLNLFKSDEYPVLAKNYREFLWTCIMPRKFPNLGDENVIEKIKQGITEYNRYLQYMNEVTKLMDEKYHVLNLQVGKTFTSMYDALFKNWRGIKQLSLDLRRNSQALDEIVHKYFMLGITSDVEETYGSTQTEGCDFYFSILGHTILNPKQFEKYFYPAIKYVFDYAEKYDKIGSFMIQGTSDRIWDLLQEVPKGHFVFQIESDDIFQMKKVFGDRVCFAGGLPTDLLGHATPQQCADYAKKLVEEIGSDGAYIMCSNKMLSFPNDAKRENLLAVNQFLADCRL